MALGDGVRRDIAMVSEAERNRFIDAIVKLDTTKFYPDGVSYWDKQEDIHKNAHFSGVDVHVGPAFIPWHRVIVNRLEQLLREVDPALSLHYWDWTTDPRASSAGRAALFTPQFMGNDHGDAGHLLNNFESSEDAELGNGHTKIWREVGDTAAKGDGTPDLASDATILGTGGAAANFQNFGAALKNAHDFTAHSYIGGTLSDAHYSFHDPFVFLLHSNLDRLWARWQTESGHPERFASATAYAGLSPADMTTLATEHVEPWAGGTGLDPWASDPTQRAVIPYTDISIVTPPCYDTNHTNAEVIQVINPGNVIHFNDVPERETAVRAAAFKIYTCQDTTLHVSAGPTAPYQPLSSDPVPVPHPVSSPFIEGRVWFEFTPAAGSAGVAVPDGTVTIQCAGQSFDFTLRANVIAPPTFAVALALDQSASMNDDAGFTGAKRHQVLKEAALRFVELIRLNNGMGFIRFDQDAHPTNDATFPGFAITRIANDANRFAARNAVSGYAVNPAGDTSVGDGVQLAHDLVNTAAVHADFNRQAIIVFTDGLENSDQLIAAVMGGITEPTYAIGLGNAQQVNTAALTRLTQGSGGYLLLTDLLSSNIDDYFLTTKYFQQILAGVSNTNLVVDPSGFIGPGTTIRIPFVLNETDIECTVILNVDIPVVEMAVETPAGDLITPVNAGGLGVNFTVGTNMSFYRFTLPVALGGGGGARGGTWHAVLVVNDRILLREAARTFGNDATAAARVQAHGARYSLSVQSYSNLKMNARLDQTSFEPGATLTLRVRLTEYDQPIDHRASVTAELRRPDTTTAVLSLSEVEPGIFETSVVATMAGVYRFRAIASGVTMRGLAFTREQTLTAGVFAGGDEPLPTSTGGGGGKDGDGGDGGVVGRNCCQTLTRLLWILAVLLFIIILILLFRGR
jgi:hypothetical protein